MENNNEEILNDTNYLKIVKIRPFSNAYNLKLKENDVILALNGSYFHSNYEELRKILDENDNEKTITILRDDIVFHVKTKSALGVVCENIDQDNLKGFEKINLDDYFNEEEIFPQYEIFKNLYRKGIVLDITPSILASFAPPLWMIYHRIWTLFAFTMIFFVTLFYVSPWLFFISWVLKSWYYGNNQVNVLRNYYRFLDYRLFAILSCKNEEEAQIKARELDPKIDFDYSYLEPPVKEEDEDIETNSINNSSENS